MAAEGAPLAAAPAPAAGVACSPVYQFGQPLSSAVLVRRASRFTLETILADGAPALLHLPNSGRLEAVLAPGATILYRPRPGDGRRVTAGNAALAAVPGLGWVTVDATLLCRAFAHILRAGALLSGAPAAVAAAPAGESLAAASAALRSLLAVLGPYHSVREEVPVGSHRFDIELLPAPPPSPSPVPLDRGDGGRPGRRRGRGSGAGASVGRGGVLLEVKSVTLARDGVGLFPDAPTIRGAEHVRALGELAAAGSRTALIFAAGRADVQEVRPNAGLDPHFAASLRAAVAAGLRPLAVCLAASPEGIRLARTVPVNLG